MKEIFIVTGTHQGEELPLGKPVADALERKLSKKYTVKRVQIPPSALKGMSRSVTTKGEDRRAEASYQYVKTIGYDPSNPSHVLLDLHEISINRKSKEIERYVTPFVEKSIDEGHYGIYYAEIANPPDFDNIWKWGRFPIGMVSRCRSNIIRIEIPVLIGKSGRIDAKSTKKHYCDIASGKLWKSEVAEKLSKIIFECFTPSDFSSQTPLSNSYLLSLCYNL
jgi:hypothetical protein